MYRLGTYKSVSNFVKRTRCKIEGKAFFNLKVFISVCTLHITGIGYHARHESILKCSYLNFRVFKPPYFVILAELRDIIH